LEDGFLIPARERAFSWDVDIFEEKSLPCDITGFSQRKKFIPMKIKSGTGTMRSKLKRGYKPSFSGVAHKKRKYMEQAKPVFIKCEAFIKIEGQENIAPTMSQLPNSFVLSKADSIPAPVPEKVPEITALVPVLPEISPPVTTLKNDSGADLIGAYTREERRQRIDRFRAKKKRRVWQKQIKYDCRKRLADTRPRVKGRFVSRRQDLLNDNSVDNDDLGSEDTDSLIMNETLMALDCDINVDNDEDDDDEENISCSMESATQDVGTSGNLMANKYNTLIYWDVDKTNKSGKSDCGGHCLQAGSCPTPPYEYTAYSDHGNVANSLHLDNNCKLVFM